MRESTRNSVKTLSRLNKPSNFDITITKVQLHPYLCSPGEIAGAPPRLLLKGQGGKRWYLAIILLAGEDEDLRGIRTGIQDLASGNIFMVGL